jgi:hypothetical protein
MSNANLHQVELDDDDDMLPEYDFSQGIRGKHAHLVGQPYSVVIHNGDGTATVQQFDGKGTMTSEQHNVWHGDRVQGDKFTGDKVMGDKVAGNKMQIGSVQGDAIAGNKIVHSQNLAQAAQDIKALINQLATDYNLETQSGKLGLSSKVLETVETNPTLKGRVVKALKEGGSKAFEEAIDHPVAKVIVAGVKGFIDG